jgi:hypothetical protein
MADSDGDSSAGVPDNDGRKFRQVSVEEQRTIFHACRATMVNGRLKRGIFSELAKSMGFQARIIAGHWHRMERSLSTLLNNHPVGEHTGIIQDSHHILFRVNHSKRRKGKYKESRAALKRRIRRVPLKLRRTRRLLAAQLNKPLTTVHWLVKERPVVGAKKYNSTFLKRCIHRPSSLR